MHRLLLLLHSLASLPSLSQSISPKSSMKASTFLTSIPNEFCGHFGVPRESSPHKQSWLEMGKGDGKKKRKKSSSPATSPIVAASAVAVPVQPQSAPQRVLSNSIIPLRHQLLFARRNKEAAKRASPSFRQAKVIRTKYKRVWTEEEVEVKKEERARKGKEPDWSVILNQTVSRPLVIVDGYNIIYKWPRLTKHMKSGDTGRARQLLIEDLEGLTTIKGWRIEVVFDGAGKSTQGVLGRGPGTNRGTATDRTPTKEVSKYGVRVVFTGVGIEADTYIEARCAEAKTLTDGSLTRSFIIATDDSMIKMAGISAGAMCMSAGRFVDELKAVKKATEYRVEVAVAKANGHAVRPEKLRSTDMAGFGRGSILIEDKRNKRKLIYTTYGGVTIIEDKNEKVNKPLDTSFLQSIHVKPVEIGILPLTVVPNQTRTL